MLEQHPILSIITVCLNEPNLERTCSSIVNQTFQDFEWIVIDGGSNKETLSVFEKYRYRINYFVSEPDSGIYFGMNKGIKQASGEWLHFLNAGDCYAGNNVLSEINLYSYMHSNIDILYGKMQMHNGQLIWYDDVWLNKNSWLSGCPVQQSATFHRKDVFKRFGGFRTDYKVVSDYAFYMQLFFNNCHFKSIDLLVTNFDKPGMSAPSNLLHVIEREKIVAEYFTQEEIQQKTLPQPGEKPIKNLHIASNLRKKIINSQTSRHPAISIQLPIYNKAAYLPECLDSIIAQTFSDFEVICVDDHSTDGSWEILQEYATRDKRFKLFRHEVNLGTLAARERCFREADGNYMAFIDADDLAEPHMLFTLHSMAQKGIDFVQCAAKLYNPGSILSDTEASTFNKGLQHVNLVQLNGHNEILQNLGISIKTNFWLSLVSRKLYKAILPYIPKGRIPQGEDNLLILMLSFFADTYLNTNEVLYCYRANPSSSNAASISPDKALEHIKSRCLAIDLAVNFLHLVAPDLDLRKHHLAFFLQTWTAYTASIIERCGTAYPEAKESLIAAHQHIFAKYFPGVSLRTSRVENMAHHLRSKLINNHTGGKNP